MKFKDMDIQNTHIDIHDSLDKILNLFLSSNRTLLPVTTDKDLIGILSLEKCLKRDEQSHIVDAVERDIIAAGIDDEIALYMNAEQSIIPLLKNNKFVGFVDIQYAQSFYKSFVSYKKKLQTYQDLEEEYRMVLESSHDVIHVYDQKGTTLRISKSCERIEGIRREDIIGKSLDELVNSSIYSQLVVQRVLETKKPATILQKTRNNKENIATGIPVFKNGELFRVIVNARDITELSELKNELQQTDKIKAELNWLRTQQLSEQGIASVDPHMNRVYQLASRISLVDSTVLIEGETGVGKEVVSKFIHRQSKRKDKPFIKIDMSALPETLLESELFGYEKGAFTGAEAKGKVGLIELADKGTLFLDEIGELPLNLQAKLLRVIQDREFYRVGGHQPIGIDVRIIAATHRNLKEMVQQKKFREDLYYRLHVVPIYIPPLRERKKDIQSLIFYYLDHFNKKYRFSKTLENDALEYLIAYHWPGNIRELQNIIERLVVTVENDIINKACLPDFIQQSSDPLPSLLSGGKNSFRDMMNFYEKRILLEAKKRANSTEEAAQQLDLDASTVRRKFNKHRISFDFK